MAGRLGIDVILSEDIETKAPKCPHGPTLLFTKICGTEQHEHGRRFYACSACRDRKDCNFFQWEDEKVSECRRLAREEYNKSHMPPFTHADYRIRYHQYIELPLHKRKFCQDCQLLLLPTEWDAHCEHRVHGDIALALLRRPSQLLHPLENKKSNAQYLFADRTCQFLLDLIITLGFRRVLCVGTPRLHELIVSRESEGKELCIQSILLDIDFRSPWSWHQEIVRASLSCRMLLSTGEFMIAPSLQSSTSFVSQRPLTAAWTSQKCKLKRSELNTEPCNAAVVTSLLE